MNFSGSSRLCRTTPLYLPESSIVADSQSERMEENLQSMANLKKNLEEQGYDIKDIPLVLQYNKRDLPDVAPFDYMEFLLNNREVQVPSFEGSAAKCDGVFETLNAITRLLLQKLLTDTKKAAAAA